MEVYKPAEVLTNWLQPRWEYLHYHSMSDGLPFERCGIAEQDGQINGFIHFEDDPAFNYLQIRPGHERATDHLLDWAQSHLGGHSPAFGRKVLGLYVSDWDNYLEQRVAERGFEPQPDTVEEHARYQIEKPISEPQLPDGFHLQSLADDNDLEKINRVLWRGFGHVGVPPAEEMDHRRRAQAAPHFRKDLTIVAVAPDGEYASYAGMWTVPDNNVGYLEPVATDPKYRRMGLGRAVVQEALRRVAAEYIRTVWVGSGLPFYQDMGFSIQNRSRLWIKLI